MDYYYSPKAKGFYVKDIHGANMPTDVINITATLYNELLQGESSGQIIMPPDAKHALPWLTKRQPTPEELKTAFTEAIQAHLDAFAQGRNYDNIFTACTYATSTNPKFAAEGQYCVEARDATWSKAYEILDEVIAGTRPMPGIEDKPAILAELPKLKWPE